VGNKVARPVRNARLKPPRFFFFFSAKIPPELGGQNAKIGHAGFYFYVHPIEQDHCK
jgi:hypothetical protein